AVAAAPQAPKASAPETKSVAQPNGVSTPSPAAPAPAAAGGNGGGAAAGPATDVVMPQMGESIFEGTITKWLKKVGDKVQRDEPLFEISTDKVDAEIPAPSSGVLREIKVQEGPTVQVNPVVAVIGGAGAPAAAPAAAPKAAPSPAATPPAREPQPVG